MPKQYSRKILFDGVKIERRPASQRVALDRLVEIVRAHPNISIGQIRAKFYEGEPPNPSRSNLTGLLNQLCEEGQIQYRDVHRYVVVEDE